MSASPAEIDLARSQPEAFMHGIELGIVAVDGYKLQEPGRVTHEDVGIVQVSLMRDEGPDGFKLERRSFDGRAATSAVYRGMEVGALDALKRRARRQVT